MDFTLADATGNIRRPASVGSPLKIVVLSQYYHEVGGTESLARDIREALTALGHQADLVYLTLPPIEDAMQERLHRCNGAHYIRYSDNISVVHALTQLEPQAVILLADLLSAVLDHFASLRCGGGFKKIVYLNVNNEAYDSLEANPGLAQGRAALLRNYDCVATMFKGSLAGKYLERHGIPYEVIDVGIPRVKPAPSSFRRRFAIPADSHLLLYPALVAPMKNQVSLIETAFETRDDVTIAFVGELYHPIADYVNSFLDALSRSNKCVHITGLNRPDVAQAMTEASLCLFPSLSEGAPLTLLEAASVGLPWIATPQVLLARRLSGGVVAEVREFPRLINRLLQDPDLLTGLGTQGVAFSRTHHRIEDTAEAFSLLVRELTGYSPCLTATAGTAVSPASPQGPEALPDRAQCPRQGKRFKVAADYAVDQDLTMVGEESSFAESIGEIFRNHRPKRIIETGTYLGEGTTRVIASALKAHGIADATFFSIECNPGNHAQAVRNLSRIGLLPLVRPLHGLSTPRALIPTYGEIKERYVKNLEQSGFDDIFIDHREHERALLYHKETAIPDVPDDLLGACLTHFDSRPDFVLLDSGGHMGNVEFNYVIDKLRGPCFIALDDIYHIKHHQSFLQMQQDSRFQIIVSSQEKFGFCIARFTPDSVDRILWLRPDSIGDNVLAASMLPYLRRKYPDALITVLCQQHIAEFYEASPLVQAVIGFDLLQASENEQYRAMILQRLQSVKADLLLNSLYSRAPLYDYFAVMSGAKQTVVCQGDLSNTTAEQREHFNSAYHKVLPSEPELRPEMERHRHFLKGLGIVAEPLAPLFWTTQADEDFASAFFADHGLTPDRCIALFAGANSRHRTYAHYGAALAGIWRDEGYTVLALGTASDQRLNQQNLDDYGAPSINLSGKLTLRQTAAILKRCRIAVGAETGTAHIACAVGTPNVVLVGGGHFGRFMPYSPLTSVVCLPLSCYFCNWNCRNEQALCVKALHPEVITYAVRETLKGKSERIRIFCQAEPAWRPLANEPPWQWRGELVADYPYELIRVSVTGTGAAAHPPELTLELEERLIPLDHPAHEEGAGIVAGGTRETERANAGGDKRYLVSAIVSTYNAERFFRGCLEDLVNQTLYRKGVLEIIIIDSGSQQDEQSIAHDFISRYDHIVYQRTEHETLYAAWNRGIDRARGRYITHGNTDDRHRADAFEVMAGELDRHHVGLVYCDAYMTTGENETFEEHRPMKQWLLPDYNLRQGLIDCPFGCQVMWRKNVHRDVGKFDPSFRCAGDYEFFLRVARTRGARHIPEIMNLYHESRSNLSYQIDEVIPEVQRFLPRLRRKVPLEQMYPFLSSDPSGTARVAALVDFANYMMGVAGFIFVDFQLAEELYADALALAPGQPDIIGNLVIAKVALEKRVEAIGLLQQCQVQTPRLKHYLDLLKAGVAPELGVVHLRHPGLQAMPPVKQLREILILLQWGPPPPGARGSAMQANPRQQQPVSAASVAGPSTADHGSRSRTGVARSYLVSAIVSTYNAERLMRGRLEDLEAQTISSALEIIVIDSGSQQNERGIVEEFQRRYDNIRYLRTERRETVYQAWNRGVRAARGEFITNANTDDRLRKDCLEILMRSLRERPDCVLAYGDMRITKDENGSFDSHEPYGYRDWPPFDRFSLLELCCIGPFPLWRRSLHDEIGYFDERYRSAADYEFWLRAALQHEFVHVAQFLGLYYLSPETVSRKGDLPNVEYLQVQHEYRPKYAELAPPALELTPEELREYEELLAASPEGSPDRLARLQRFAERHPRSAPAHHHLAELYYKGGDLGYARKYFEKAALLDLHSPLHTGMLHSFLKAELYQSLQHYNNPGTAGDELERHLILGMICTVLERLDAARSCYLRTLEIDPCDGAARANLAYLDARLGLPSDPPSTAGAGVAEGGGGSAGYCHAV